MVLQWQTLPIPSTSQLGMEPKGVPRTAFQFPPPCYEPTLPQGLAQGRCSGEWTPNITIHDQLRVRADIIGHARINM